MKEVALCRQEINLPLNLFSILSKSDNLLMFCVAKEGLKTNSSKLHNDIPTKKRYYSALKQLKDAGLIEKSPEYRGTYFHTTYGSMIYQREIVEMAEYAKNVENIKTTDTLKKTNKYPEKCILKLVQDVFDNDKNIDNNIISSPSTSTSFTSEFISSYKELNSSLIDKIRGCNNEILIATRINSEELINEIILKAKVGVKVKVVADKKLVQGYFKSQAKFCKSINEKDDDGKQRMDNDKKSERIKVIGNPWYPNSEGIERRISDIPFGIIVIDGKEAGIEMINRLDIQNFFAAIFIKDEKFATNVKELYLKIWNNASDNSNPLTVSLTNDTERKH